MFQDGRWHLIGITSFGSGCAKPGFPDVFVRISKYSHWIHETINNWRTSVPWFYFGLPFNSSSISWRTQLTFSTKFLLLLDPWSFSASSLISWSRSSSLEIQKMTPIITMIRNNPPPIATPETVVTLTVIYVFMLWRWRQVFMKADTSW